MFISILNNIQGDDYTMHKIVQKYSCGKKVLFQRRATITHVLSESPLRGDNIVSTYIGPVIENIKAGDHVDFNIRVNPVISRRINPHKSRGALKAVPSNDLERWLNGKFIKYGFLANFFYDMEGFRESVKDGSVVSLNSLLVNGTLEVLNPESVKQALTMGIGRGKCFGFGLLHIYDSFLAGNTGKSNI